MKWLPYFRRFDSKEYSTFLLTNADTNAVNFFAGLYRVCDEGPLPEIT